MGCASSRKTTLGGMHTRLRTSVGGGSRRSSRQSDSRRTSTQSVLSECREHCDAGENSWRSGQIMLSECREQFDAEGGSRRGSRQSLLKECREQIDVFDVASSFYDKYVLGVKLGCGTFGQVRVAMNINERASPVAESVKERAVKIIDLRGESGMKKKQSALREEQNWMTVGNHSNCVHFYEAFHESSLCFMVMEKCSSSLLHHLETMPDMTERFLGHVINQMLQGIAHVHSSRIVHKDVKPDNFLIGGVDSQTVKLADFSLSSALPETGKLFGVSGTAQFMCPEMVQGVGYDEKADMWSLGVVVYILFFGEFPYVPIAVDDETKERARPPRRRNSASMKKAIVDGAPPKFKPVRMSAASNANLRSKHGVNFVKALLNRETVKRPSAMCALRMEYIGAVEKNSLLRGYGLPCLKPMLQAAKEAGAFQVCNECQSLDINDSLDVLVLQNQKNLNEVDCAASPDGCSTDCSSDRSESMALEISASELLPFCEATDHASYRLSELDRLIEA